VAEAAKVIENTQRDLNIALMNELAIIFDRIGIDTLKRSWKRPAANGISCLSAPASSAATASVSIPYYLTHKAEMLGYHPEVINAGRRINDGMGKFIAEQTVKQLIRNGWQVKGAPIIVLGLTFKEDCPDLRNSRVIDVIRELEPMARRCWCMNRLPTPTRPARIRRRTDDLGAATGCCGDRRGGCPSPVQGAAARRLRRQTAAGRRPADMKSMFNEAELAAQGVTVWRL
jgi:UDP-N-acetyl-D-galactosamine dehydrogenase